jgi:hypothetical protein
MAVDSRLDSELARKHRQSYVIGAAGPVIKLGILS